LRSLTIRRGERSICSWLQGLENKIKERDGDVLTVKGNILTLAPYFWDACYSRRDLHSRYFFTNLNFTCLSAKPDFTFLTWLLLTSTHINYFKIS
jgi:hypothetical protein